MTAPAPDFEPLSDAVVTSLAAYSFRLHLDTGVDLRVAVGQPIMHCVSAEALLHRVGAELQATRVELTLAQGAMRAQDEREQLAGARCGVSWAAHDCDWPEWVADALIAERVQSATERKVREEVIALAGQLQAKLDAAAPYTCPTCGPHARVDADECCATCGTDAVRAPETGQATT